jgi:hypothetical protein
MAQGAGVNSSPFANSVATYGQVSRTLETSDYYFVRFYNVIKINYGGPDTGHGCWPAGHSLETPGLRRYATRWRVAGSRPDYVNALFQFT